MRWAATCVVVLLATIAGGSAAVCDAVMPVAATVAFVPTVVLEVEPLDDAVALRLTLLHGAAESDVDVLLDGAPAKIEPGYWAVVPARGRLPEGIDTRQAVAAIRGKP